MVSFFPMSRRNSRAEQLKAARKAKSEKFRTRLARRGALEVENSLAPLTPRSSSPCPQMRQAAALLRRRNTLTLPLCWNRENEGHLCHRRPSRQSLTFDL